MEGKLKGENKVPVQESETSQNSLVTSEYFTWRLLAGDGRKMELNPWWRQDGDKVGE